jgi:predicted acyltransferase
MNQRYLSVDIFRGLTIMLMIIVNSLPASPHTTWLQHSEWNGCHLADCVFPFFLIIMGVSIQLRTHPPTLIAITKRVLLLFSLGILINAIPYFHHIRYLGVMQRLAICYGFAALISWHISYQMQIIIMTLLLYWLMNIIFATTLIGSMSQHCSENFIGCFDQLVMGNTHLFTPYFDPEGLISSIPAICQTLIGCLIGYQLKHSANKPPIKSWLLNGALLLVLGYVWNLKFPFNKSIWSSSYVLWTSGFALWTLSACQWIKQCRVAQLFGQHSLLIFVVHVLGLKLLHYFKLKPIIYSNLQHILPVDIASLCYALVYLVLSYIFLKIYEKVVHALSQIHTMW